jgi:hypothetical protein
MPSAGVALLAVTGARSCLSSRFGRLVTVCAEPGAGVGCMPVAGGVW